MAARRYGTRPKRRRVEAEGLDDPPLLPDLLIYHADPEPRPTGVLDRHGDEIVVTEVADPIGFVRFRDG